jgi:hypothetical protein
MYLYITAFASEPCFTGFQEVLRDANILLPDAQQPPADPDIDSSQPEASESQLRLSYNRDLRPKGGRMPKDAEHKIGPDDCRLDMAFFSTFEELMLGVCVCVELFTRAWTRRELEL